MATTAIITADADGTSGDDYLIGSGTLEGFEGNDTLRARGDDVTLLGGDGSDRLYGDYGDDSLHGGAGADFMDGGFGYDTYYVDDAGDVIFEATREEHGADTVYTTVSYTLAETSGVEAVFLEGEANLNFTGTRYGENVYGNSGNNVVIANGGDDYIYGDGGNDSLNGGDGNDELESSRYFDDLAGASTLVGGRGDDYFMGADRDVIVEQAGGGNDFAEIRGWSGERYDLAQNIEGLNYYAGELDAEVYGNAANNTLIVYGDTVEVYGLAGNDWIEASPSDDGAMYVDGGAGNDTIYAQGEMHGGGGNDLMLGGNSAVMYGETGNDTFWFLGYAPGEWGIDTAADYHGNQDSIFLEGFENLGYRSTLSAASFYAGAGAVAQDSSDRIIYDTATGALFHDADGVGGEAQVQFATVNLVGGTFNHQDFILRMPSPTYPSAAASFMVQMGDVGTLDVGDPGIVLLGTEGADTLTGSDGDDIVEGFGGNDRLEGGDGSDELYGGAGRDTLVGGEDGGLFDGGAGADVMRGSGVFYVDHVNDRIVIEGGDDYGSLVYTSAPTLTLVEGIKIAYAGYGDIEIIGNAMDNIIFGNEDDNRLEGRMGDDDLYGYGGNDTILGGAGDDDIESGEGQSVLRGGGGDDDYIVRGGATVIEAEGGGYDSVVVEAYSDMPEIVLQGEIESIAYHLDLYDHNQHDATLNGTETDNYMEVYASGANVFAGAGNDYIYYSSGYGVSLLDGGGGRDEIHGDTFNSDEIRGGGGNDTLDGGGGFDTLTGGSGNDLFLINAYNGISIISDFQGNGDTLFLDVGIAGGEERQLHASEFRTGTGDSLVAQHADDYILYDTAEGMLYYDPDANGMEYGRELLVEVNVASGVFNHQDILVT